jgi:hypothetical protein
MNDKDAPKGIRIRSGLAVFDPSLETVGKLRE